MKIVVSAIDHDARRFLIVFALGPLLALMAIAVASGINTKPAWTASMSTTSGLLAIALASGRFTESGFRRLISGAAAVLIGIAAVYAADSLLGNRAQGRYRPQQASWPAVEIAHLALQAWSQEAGAPLHVVVGETRLAGVVALAAPTDPSVLSEGEYWRSPWVTPERVKREGALIIWSEPGGLPPNRMRELAGTATIHHAEVAWPRAPGKPPLQLFYAVKRPEPTK